MCSAASAGLGHVFLCVCKGSLIPDAVRCVALRHRSAPCVVLHCLAYCKRMYAARCGIQWHVAAKTTQGTASQRNTFDVNESSSKNSVWRKELMRIVSAILCNGRSIVSSREINMLYLSWNEDYCLLFGTKLGFSRILDSPSSAHRMHDFTDFRQPNFTKFEHNTSIGVAMNPFGTEFWQFSRKGSFLKKTHKWFFNVLRLQAAITPQWL